MNFRGSAAVVGLLGLALAGGCGGEPTVVTSTVTAPAPQAKAPEPEPEPESETEGNPPAPPGGRLRTVAPSELSGDDAPEEFLPKPFPLPGPARVREGAGGYEKARGLFFLEINASVADVKDYFDREYPANGWETVTENDVEVDGEKGFNLFYQRDGYKRRAVFRGQEGLGGGTVVEVQYTN